MTIKAIQKLNKQLLTILEDNKASDCVLLDIRDVTDMADYMIIASGSSRRHIHLLGEKLALHAKRNSFKPLSISGNAESDWVLVDLGAIIIHVMIPEARKLYDLEELWGHSISSSKSRSVTTKKKAIAVKTKIIKTKSKPIKKCK